MTPLRDVLLEWKERELPEIIPRELNITLTSNITAIIGPRRAGKTYFMFHIIKSRSEEKRLSRENAVYLDFEDFRLKKLTDEQLSILLKEIHSLFKEKDKKIYLFLDEIQNVNGWQNWLRTLHNSGRYYLFISGSSSKLLAKEIATQLRGRYRSNIIFPFSFREFLSSKKFVLNKEQSRIREGEMLRMLNEYLLYGGYPEIITKSEDKEKTALLKNYYEVIFYKDIVDRFKIRNLALMDAFTRYIIQNYSGYLSLSKTEKYFKSLNFNVSKKTLANYLRYLREVLFVFSVERYSHKVKERLKMPVKIYSIDLGFFWLEPRTSKDTGKRLENCVAIKLFKNALEDPTISLFYYKVNTHEVDFVVGDGFNVKQLIQVTYASSIDAVDKRETRALLKASGELNCNDLTIITWDFENELKLENKIIKCVPLWKWLLD